MPSETLAPHEALAINAFIQGSPGLWPALREATDVSTKIDLLKGHLANLKAQSDVSRKELQDEYRKRMDTRFSDVSWARALAGAPCKHKVSFTGIMAFEVQAPSAKRTHDVRSYLQQSNDAATTEPERIVLEWVQSIQLLQETGDGKLPAAVAWAELPLGSLLERVRQLPEVSIAKVADECVSMQTWLAGKLEDNLGNS